MNINRQEFADALADAMNAWNEAHPDNAEPAAGSHRWRRAEMRKLRDIRIEKYDHVKPGYTWDLFKAHAACTGRA